MNLPPNWLASLPDPQGDLEHIQIKARNCLQEGRFPTRKTEDWRLSKIDRLEKFYKLPYLDESNQTNSLSNNEWPEPPKDAFRIVLNSNRDPLRSIDLPQGISTLSKKELEQQLGQTLEHCSCNSDWPILFNEATATKLLPLKVHGSNLPPLELVIYSQADELCSTRVLLVLEENSNFQLLEVVIANDNSAHSHLTEVHLGKDSNLNHGWVGLGGGNASLMAHLALEQEIGSNYSLATVQQGWNFARFEPRIVQLHGHASTKVRGLQFSSSNEQVGTYSSVRFDGPDGCLEQLQKAVANKSSHCIFSGGIKVPRMAQRTNAEQLSRNMILSNHARIDTKPELEIVADDVRCAHGATVSYLQEEELFYLRSRGINSNEATDLLLKGYFEDVLNTLPLDAERWNIVNTLLAGINK